MDSPITVDQDEAYALDSELSPRERRIIAGFYSSIPTATIPFIAFTGASIGIVTYSIAARLKSPVRTNLLLSTATSLVVSSYLQPSVEQFAFRRRLPKLKESCEACFNVVNNIGISQWPLLYEYYRITGLYPEKAANNPKLFSHTEFVSYVDALLDQEKKALQENNSSS